jgi:hypothetical protein
MHRQLSPIVLLFLCSCSTKLPETLERPPNQQVHSRVSRGSDGDILVAATFSGGGAGDTVYRLLACQPRKADCEVLGSIGASELPKPEISQEGGRVRLTVNKSDSINGFKNFSRSLRGLDYGSVYLYYRE